MAVLQPGALDHARQGDTADTWSALHIWAARHECVHVDLGTGDGRYALRVARSQPGTAVIGLDTNLDRLRGAKRRHPDNLRFVRADALTWPVDAIPRADLITINFPYGSILHALVDVDSALIDRVDSLLAPGGRIEVRLNASALVACGREPTTAPAAIASGLRRIEGLRVASFEIDNSELRAFPSNWARRLGHGASTRAWAITGCRHARFADCSG